MLLTANDKPADHAESNEKGNLAKGNLLKSIGKWLKKEESKPNCRERADCDTPRDSCAARTMPQTDGETDERQTKCEVCDRSPEPVTTPMVGLQSHHRTAAAENVPTCDSSVHAECADAEEKTTNNGSDRSEEAHAI